MIECHRINTDQAVCTDMQFIFGSVYLFYVSFNFVDEECLDFDVRTLIFPFCCNFIRYFFFVKLRLSLCSYFLKLTSRLYIISSR